MDYKTYIRSTEWLDRKEEFFKTHQRKCKACYSTKNVCLHHLTYENIFNEPDSDLMPLCKGCHNEAHRMDRKRGRIDYTLRENTMAFLKERRSANPKRKRRSKAKASTIGVTTSIKESHLEWYKNQRNNS